MDSYFSTKFGTLYNMDCVDGLKQIGDNSIDLVVTSPPYDNLRKYNGFSFDFESVAKELYRVVKKGRYCCVDCWGRYREWL